ncbi:MAG: exodeoxyribonuclease VII large subunit [Actinomycetota bacterium]
MSGSSTEEVYTVKRFANRVSGHIQRIGSFMIQGEVTGVRSRNGHLSFKLREEEHSVGAFCHARIAGTLPFELAEGLMVVGRAKLSYFEARGNVQINFSTLEPRDEGALQLALRQLTEKLEKEGLFAAERKRPLPRFPSIVGVVTSRDGAVWRDICQTLQRRWPGLTVRLFPVAVQGADAAPQISRAIRGLGRTEGTDVILVGRGGGAIEDLWAFNSEEVARAIVDSPVPVVSCVGHATDRTIADLVSDRSAPTPTAAAEMVTPVTMEDVLAKVSGFERRVSSALRRRVEAPRARLAALQRRRLFRHPSLLTEPARLRLDKAAGFAREAVTEMLRTYERSLVLSRSRLHSASPLSLLERGFAVVEKDGKTVRSPEQVSEGDRLRIRVHGGDIQGEVV